MSILGRSPSVFLGGGNTVGVLVSEHLYRDRGSMTLTIEGEKIPYVVVQETPFRNERVVMTSLQNGSQFNKFFPVLVLEKDAEKGATPFFARYLRHALNPQIVYDNQTNQYHVYFWWNTYTPLVSNQMMCQRVSLIPVETTSLGGHRTWPHENIPAHLALREASFGNVEENLYGDGVVGRAGVLKIRLGKAVGSLPKDMRWIGASIRLSASRFKFDLDEPSGNISSDIEASEVPLPVEFQPPYQGFQVQKDNYYTIRSRISIVVGNDKYTFKWANAEGLQEQLELIPSEGSTLRPQNFNGVVKFQNPLENPDTPIFLEFETYVDPLAWPREEKAALLYRNVEVILECFDAGEAFTQQYYEGPRLLPIPYTAEIPEYEPHAFPRVQSDPKYQGTVGDPPEENSGGFAGMYNRNNTSDMMLVGGTAQAKFNNPLQTTDGHQKLPETPGLIIPERLISRAQDIDLKSIQDNIETHTQHLYHQREVQDLRMCSRTLMHTTGQILNLRVKEKRPKSTSSATVNPNALRIGAANLRPGYFFREYKGSRFVTLRATTLVFPFGAAISSGPGAVAVTAGDTGHQFEASGGRPPYAWTIRRTRSSESNPARSIDLRKETNEVIFGEEYPFDSIGRPVVDVEFPATVVGGGLPEGMALTNSGLLYGTPRESGTFIFRLVCQDRDGRVAEETIRFYVASGLEGFFDDYDEATTRLLDPSNRTRLDETLNFKTEIIKAVYPEVTTTFPVKEGELVAIGGKPPYRWRLVNPFDTPNQGIPTGSNGSPLSVTPSGTTQVDIRGKDNLDGLWVFELEAKESYPDEPTIDRTATALAINVPLVSVFKSLPPEESTEGTESIPEGEYVDEEFNTAVLILKHPNPVKQFTEAQNVMLRGTRGHFTNLGSSGTFIGPGPITSASPGVMAPVGVVGVFELGYSSAKYQLDFAVGNPSGIWTQIDKFDPTQIGEVSPPPPPSPPPQEGEIIVEDVSVSSQTQIAKRIRPLWPG